VRRAWSILLLVVFTFGATDVPGVLNALIAGEAGHGCAESCPSDFSSKEDCSPRCPACPCAPHGAPLMSPAERTVPSLPTLALAGPSVPPSRLHSEAHLRSVFHPPTAR